MKFKNILATLTLLFLSLFTFGQGSCDYLLTLSNDVNSNGFGGLHMGVKVDNNGVGISMALQTGETEKTYSIPVNGSSIRLSFTDDNGNPIISDSTYEYKFYSPTGLVAQGFLYDNNNNSVSVYFGVIDCTPYDEDINGDVKEGAQKMGPGDPVVGMDIFFIKGSDTTFTDTIFTTISDNFGEFISANLSSGLYNLHGDGLINDDPYELLVQANQPNDTVHLFVEDGNLVGEEGATPIDTTDTTTTTAIDVVIYNTDRQFKVFPNPSNGVFKIEGRSDKITIINSIGQIVNFSNLTSMSKTFDLSDEEKGMYFLYIENNGIITNRKILVD